MPNRLDKIVRITQIAAVAYRAAIPARCVTTPAPKKTIGGSAASSGSFDYPISHYDGSGNYNPLGEYRTYSRPSPSAPPAGNSTVCYPAVAGVAGSPARLIIDLYPGWGGGAQSLAALAGNFLFSLLPTTTPIGVAFGIVAPYSPPDFNAIEHGFKLSAGRISIIQSGVEVAVCPSLPAAGLRLFIARNGSRITYMAGAWSYVSATPSNGNKAAAALLYSHGDYVTDPMIAVAAEADLSARGRAGFSSGPAGTLTARSRAGFRSVTRKSTARVGFKSRANISAGGASLFLPALTVRASDFMLGRALITLPALSVEASGGYALPSIGFGAIGIPAPLITGLVKVGGIGRCTSQLKGMTMRGSDHPTGGADMRLPAITVNGSSVEYDPEGAFMYEVCQVFNVIIADAIVYARWREDIGVGAQLLISAIVADSIYDSIIARDTMNAAQVMFEVIRGALEISTSSGAVDDVVMQYATNMLTGAATRFDGFGFEGFATSGLDCYAYNPSGVYAIRDGAGDNGAAIAAAIDFAMVGTDSSFNKRIENLYFGLASDGSVYARVKTEHGPEITYKATASQSAYRAVCAKGAQSRHWALKLEVTNATYADLDSVEWDVKAMTRRANQ
jgi:hypothetical protein